MPRFVPTMVAAESLEMISGHFRLTGCILTQQTVLFAACITVDTELHGRTAQVATTFTGGGTSSALLTFKWS